MEKESFKTAEECYFKSRYEEKTSWCPPFQGHAAYLSCRDCTMCRRRRTFHQKMIDDAPDITPEDVKPSKFTTQALADDEITVLDTFVDAGANRVYKSIDEIPKDLQNAFVAIEDSRFYEHNGIDLKGIVRAGLKGIISGHFSEGASTLTQQLIKNNVFPNFVNEDTFLTV